MSNQFKILDILYPIFSDDPASYLYPSHLHQMNQFNNSSSPSNYHFNNDKSSNHNSLCKTYSPYPTSTSALNLLATSQDSNSVVDDTVPQVNDTYGIYHHHNHHQQPRDNHNNYLSYSQQEHSYNPNYYSSSCTSNASTTNVKSVSFLTDYSTANTNNNQDSVQRRSNCRQNQDRQGK